MPYPGIIPSLVSLRENFAEGPACSRAKNSGHVTVDMRAPALKDSQMGLQLGMVLHH